MEPFGGGGNPKPQDAEKSAALYFERRRSKGLTLMEAQQVARKPLYFASLMVAAGDADGAVGGAVNTTAETVRAALHCIGPAAGVRTGSGVFFVCVQDRGYGHAGWLAFADCGLVVDPSAGEVAEVAIAAGHSTAAIIRTEPEGGLLSFPPQGRAKHPL